MANPVELTYVALRTLQVGGQKRHKGDLVPEAASWKNTDAYIRGGYISSVPRAAVNADELAAAEERMSASEEPTKDELYEEAQELDVEGRSSMNKEELADAVEEAGEPDGVPEPDLEEFSVGGGWYEVPGASKKMRRDEALEFLTSPETGEE